MGKGHLKGDDSNVGHQGGDRDDPEEEVDDLGVADGDGVAGEGEVVVDDGDVDEVHAVAHPGQGLPGSPGQQGVNWATCTLHTCHYHPAHCQGPGKAENTIFAMFRFYTDLI